MISSTQAASNSGQGHTATSKDHICVAVRLRPLSHKEELRGDRDVWEVQHPNQIAIKQGIGISMMFKYAYDTVFNPDDGNQQVYEGTTQRIVQSAMDGINGTVFAYGVTSSGKTHTMMGDRSEPGVVPRAVWDVFDIIEKTPGREFLLRLSMMEIYNEVLNDLLDPSRANLRLREDAKRGFFAEGIKEETLVSKEHALSIIAAGDANRKVGATAYNEGSSRSHTLIRLSVESSERPDPDADPRAAVARTLSFLNLIDLAGSESAKVTLNKGQTREGAFINKSLLTLGSVIGKLSDGNAAHIPFRDSKLTRLLQASLTGNGARVAVVCTITPASSQAEETHNTLKFATRAKKVAIAAQRNEIMDQSSLIRRYQEEISQLRSQLEVAARDRGASITGHDPLHPEVRNLRERLEEEHQALLKRDADKAGLEVRLARLTKLILHSTRTHTVQAARKRQRNDLLRCFSAHEKAILNAAQGPGGSGSSLETSISAESIPSQPARLQSNASDAQRLMNMSSGSNGSLWNEGGRPNIKQRRAATADLDIRVPAHLSSQQRFASLTGAPGARAAGELIPGNSLLYQVSLQQEDVAREMEREYLQEKLQVLADELEFRDRELAALRTTHPIREETLISAGSWGFPQERTPDRLPSDLPPRDPEQDLELQILYAERDFMRAQLQQEKASNAELQQALLDARQAAAGDAPRPALLDSHTDMSISGSSMAEEVHENLSSPAAAPAAAGPDQPAAVGEAPAQAQPARQDSSSSVDSAILASCNRLADELSGETAADGQGPSGVESEAPGRSQQRQSMIGTRAMSPEVAEKLDVMDKRVQFALEEIKLKDTLLQQQRKSINHAQHLELKADARLREALVENADLRLELARLETQTNLLQGYGLDDTSAEDLSKLIESLTQAVERVRITVQLRRLQSTAREGRKTPPQSGASTPRLPSLPEPSGGSFTEPRLPMSLDTLRKAMANHGVHSDTAGPGGLSSTGSGFTRFSIPARPSTLSDTQK
ncbi:hypothetical protein WJX74_007412 [Apatococcus lobatus]|uniref:Kinesin motor domain-containing protein n=1 Tax=Apatococcus lobatus TaxID=904363 RepID=A0AAW1QJ66_9CHLO